MGCYFWGDAFPLVTHHNDAIMAERLLIDIRAVEEGAIDGEVLGQMTEQLYQIGIDYLHPGNTSHGGLYHLGVIGISSVQTTEDSGNAEPVGYADNRAEITRILHIIKGKKQFIGKRRNIFLISQERILVNGKKEEGHYLLRMLQETESAEILFRENLILLAGCQVVFFPPLLCGKDSEGAHYLHHVTYDLRAFSNEESQLLAPLLVFEAAYVFQQVFAYHIAGEYLLDKVRVETDAKEIDVSQMSTYIHQQANSKWFSLFKVPLGTYGMAGRDTTKWLNRTLRNIGEEPVVYDSLLAKQTCEDLQDALHNMGYMNGYVTLDTKTHRHKLTAIYTLHPGIPYFIRSVKYDIQDDSVAKVLDIDHAKNLYLKEGMKFSASELDNARKQMTQQLTHAGFYRFHKDFIRFYADTTRGSKMVDLTMQLMPYQSHSDAEVTFHPRYKIRQVNFMSGDDGKLHLRRSVLRENTWLKEGDFYSSQNLQRTYNSFGRLSAVRYTSIKFNEVPDSNLLDCNIQISTYKPNSVSFQPEGTNTAGDLGAAATLTYENRNLFKGSETFSVQLRGAFEAITGLEGYQNQDYEEYNMEAKLSFPRFIAPVSKSYRKRSSAASELSVSYNMQNRPEFHRRLFSAAWRCDRLELYLHAVDIQYVQA